MNKQTNRHLPSTAWKPGQSGNAAGRPPGARQKIAEKLIADIADVWEACGKDVLKRLAIEEPAKLATIAYGLVPKDIFLNVAQTAPGGLEPDEWATLRRVLDIIQATAPDGVAPSLVFETIEHALRAEFARPIALPAPPY
ncbi:DUF5681 domain-containing protein [Bradyrhizobium sp. CCBAU 51627]|uniref:DUF5681 domain-containing protein n=1 Tax=Bradyrhizobium sp. CCBAU 51627 TaxID=1325088 RepID=UPI002306A7B3|nr:DUF5681 domain-containing protein [Bradyrhizobium sp. CCBAU 51627]MDA9437250.1 hypothetical protein [Bradyrhizobium sp. CCBAU 51627]